MVGTEGIAPSASCMSGRGSAAELRPRKWCSRLGSHRRPPPSDDGALLTELRERFGKDWSGTAGFAPAISCTPCRRVGCYATSRFKWLGLAPTSSTVTGWTLVSSNSRPTNWLPELESHQHPPLQRRLNCCYSIRAWWAARDSHPDLTA